MNTNGKILIVEDYQNWREQLQRLLAKEGFIVETAKSFEEAKGILRRQMFDFAVVDIRLSESIPDAEHDAVQMEETLREIQKYGDDVPVVVLSAYGTPSLVRDALKRFGAVDFIEKAKYDRDQLLSLARMWVQNATAKRSANPPRLDISLVGYTHLEALVKQLIPRMDVASAMREIGKFLNELLRGMLPLSPEGIKLDVVSTTPRLASVWCWSRKQGHALVVELRDYEEPKELLRPQLAARWQVVASKSSFWSAIDLSGVVYTLTDMSFPEFLTKIGGER